VARRAFSFDLVEKEEHEGLTFEEDEETGYKRVFTKGKFNCGNWNTVMGDTELPKSGKAYWEVKVVKKMGDNFEYIGVSEANVEPSRKLAQNRNGQLFCWGGNHEDTFTYAWLKSDPKWHQIYKDEWMADAQRVNEEGGDQKEWDQRNKLYEDRIKGVWQPKKGGCTIGMHMDQWPKIRQGTVIGVEADMDKGTIGYWADGDYLGIVKDTYGKPADLKGKKLFPAVSVFGRTDGGGRFDGTVLELRTGLEPPSGA
jgi:hypothetical protein